MLLLFHLGRQEEERAAKLLLHSPPAASLAACPIPQGLGRGGFTSSGRISETLRNWQAF